MNYPDGREVHVTLRDFMNYADVQRSNVTNMLNRDLVCKLAEISKEVYMEILKNYHHLMDIYPEVDVPVKRKKGDEHE